PHPDQDQANGTGDGDWTAVLKEAGADILSPREALNRLETSAGHDATITESSRAIAGLPASCVRSVVESQRTDFDWVGEENYCFLDSGVLAYQSIQETRSG